MRLIRRWEEENEQGTNFEWFRKREGWHLLMGRLILNIRIAFTNGKVTHINLTDLFNNELATNY